MLIIQYAPAPTPPPSSNMPVPSLSDDAPGGEWPLYTNLVYVPGKEPTLGHQTHEVQAIVRKAFDIIGEKIIFQNSFPGLAERAIWFRSALRTGCFSIFDTCTNSLVQDRYAKLWRRLSDDYSYVRVLSKLVTCLPTYISACLIPHLG